MMPPFGSFAFIMNIAIVVDGMLRLYTPVSKVPLSLNGILGKK